MTGFISKLDSKQRVNLSEYAQETIESDLVDFEGDKPAFSHAVSKVFLIYNRYAKHDAETVQKYTKTKPRVYIKQAPRLQNEVVRIIEKNEEILNRNYDGIVGKYVKSVIEQYAELPYLEREQVYFADIVRLLEAGIRNSERLLIETDEGSFLIRPYLILSDRLSTYNYLACYSKSAEGNEDDVNVFRISRIERVAGAGEDGTLADHEKDFIKSAIEKRGLPFLRNETKEIIIRLTANGKILYSNLIQNRPIYDSNDGDIYTFICTESQAKFYFFKFGADAEVIEPESLRRQFAEMYISASGLYTSS